MLGELCWGVLDHHQVNLSMNFGDPHLSVIEPKPRSSVEKLRRSRTVTPKGEYWLWALTAYWSIRRDGKTLASTSSSARARADAVAQLDGQRLIDVEVSDSNVTRLTFDLGVTLELRRMDDEPGKIWDLYRPDGTVLSLATDGTFTHKPASKKPAPHRTNQADG
jgi:hypothetical protein